MAAGEQLRMYDRAIYRITVQGLLDERWSDWLEGLRIVSVEGVGAAVQTVLEGDLTDQSALVGVLGVLQGLGLPVIGVEYLGQDNSTIRQREES
ncbi:MAG: hypothetical protein ACK47M_05885 [Caldilinea sp.]